MFLEVQINELYYQNRQKRMFEAVRYIVEEHIQQ